MAEVPEVHAVDRRAVPGNSASEIMDAVGIQDCSSVAHALKPAQASPAAAKARAQGWAPP